jgi:hypothetical protein
VDSRKNKAGDEVTAKTASDVVSQGKVIIPRNSKLIGHVTEAKAKANGESDSTLGIAFDRAILKNGQSVPLNATIQALAAPAATASSTINDDAYASSGPARPAGGGGGVVGGVAGSATNTVGAVGNTAGNVTGAAGSTVNSTVSGVGPSTANVGSTLSSGTTGVVGLKDLQLNSATSSATNGSVITSTGKNVKLESGSQMILKTGASTAGTANQ